MNPQFEPIAADPSCDFCSRRRTPAAIAVDAAYCISLIEQPERTARATAHFHAVGLCRLVTFYRPERAKNTDRGVWDSHRAVAVEALARGQRRILIMEDDVAFHRPMDALAPRINRALDTLPANWWGLYLGHFPFQAYFVGPGLMRARSSCAHAYVANAPMLHWLADTRPMAAEVPMWRWLGPAVDSAMSNLPEMYAVVPMMAVQIFQGEFRIDPRGGVAGKPRAWNEADRWRHVGIYRGSRIAEALAVAGSPYHRITLERNLERVRDGTSRDAKIVRASGLFDDQYYLRTYSDIAAADVDPLLHYLMYGTAEWRWPNASFDPVYYASHAGLRRGENPLLHYIRSGRERGLATIAPAAGASA